MMDSLVPSAQIIIAWQLGTAFRDSSNIVFNCPDYKYQIGSSKGLFRWALSVGWFGLV